MKEKLLKSIEEIKEMKLPISLEIKLIKNIEKEVIQHEKNEEHKELLSKIFIYSENDYSNVYVPLYLDDSDYFQVLILDTDENSISYAGYSLDEFDDMFEISNNKIESVLIEASRKLSYNLTKNCKQLKRKEKLKRI